MLYGIYSMYDVAMKCYAQPFYQANDDVAKRTFAIAINNPKAETLYQIRDDLELWLIGYFDDRCGNIFYTNGEEKYKLESDCPRRIVGRGEAVIKAIEKESEENTNEV